MKKGFRRTIALLALLTAWGCGLQKNSPQVTNQPGASTPTSMNELTIKPEDWLIDSSNKNGVDISKRTLKPEKIEFVRKNFRAPSLTPITVSESNGFEVYEIHGYKELESSVYIHPKVYLNTSSTQGSIMGYRTGLKDTKGVDIIEISIPVALVNGMVPAVATIGNSNSDEEPIVKLPSNYIIPDLAALQAKVGKPVATLPVCPDGFRLKFENKEYWATSPFEGLSNCPLNQFFRITFRAPADEMNRMLETAAIRSEAVSLFAFLSVVIDLPKQVVELQVDPSTFQKVLNSKLANVGTTLLDNEGKTAYLLPELEGAVQDSLIEVAKMVGLTPHISSDILSQTRKIILKYFKSPFSCAQMGACTSLRKIGTQNEPIKFSWMDSESLASTLHTETVASLGAVANSNPFIAKPTRDQLKRMRRPEFFKSWPFETIIPVCAELSGLGWPEKYQETRVNYGSTEDEKTFFKEYCNQIVANSVRNDADMHQSDGYYPFITSTTVYPGAWIKIDVKEISELTTAKTRTESDGRVVVESKLVDVLSLDSKYKTGLTSCSEGSDTPACLEYETETVPTRDEHGDQIIGLESCKQGEAGCTCEKKSDSDPTLVCGRKVPLTHEALKYDCSGGVESTYCPYWKTQEDIVGYDISYDCQDVKTGSKTSFLCTSGCSETHDLICKEHDRKPIKASRNHLACKGFDGDIPPERYCTKPRYLCKRWEKRCSHYNVNEVFQIVHEEVTPRWRPLSVASGEYPPRFEEDIYLKFVSPNSVVTNCKLGSFDRDIRGNSLYIKLPTVDKDFRCEGKPLWNDNNTQPYNLPKVYLKNAIAYPEQRLCGITEYSLITNDISNNSSSELVPSSYSSSTVAHIGPVPNSCRAENPFRVGDDLWFTEYPPIRFTGRVSVLGRVLESIVTEERK